MFTLPVQTCNEIKLTSGDWGDDYGREKGGERK